MSATAGLIYTSQYMPAIFHLLVMLIENDFHVLHAKSPTHICSPKWRHCGHWMNGTEPAASLHASQLELDVVWWLRTFAAAREQRPQQTELYTESHLEIEMAYISKRSHKPFQMSIWIRGIVYSTWRDATLIGYITTKKWPTERASSNIV